MNSRQRTLGHAAALMTILIWGTTFVSTKVLLRDFTPVTVLFTRFVIGYAFLWCLRPRLLPLSGWKKELLFAGAGLTGVTLYFLLENIALTYTFASNVGIIVAVVPFFTALLARFKILSIKASVSSNRPTEARSSKHSLVYPAAFVK